MADIESSPKRRGPTWDHLWAIVPLLVVGLIAWGAMTADFRALAQRVDAGERRDEKAADSMDVVKTAIGELRGDAKWARAELERQGRQLDRIENLLRGQAVPPAPTFNPPR